MWGVGGRVGVGVGGEGGGSGWEFLTDESRYTNTTTMTFRVEAGRKTILVSIQSAGSPLTYPVDGVLAKVLFRAALTHCATKTMGPRFSTNR